MKGFLWIVGLLVLASGVARGSDDKYLVRLTAPARDVASLSRFPSTIVVYAPPGTPSTDWLLGKGFDQELAGQGHCVYLVRSEIELNDVLRYETMDLIVGDFSLIDGLPTGPSFLPIVDASNRDQMPLLREKYAYIVKTPGLKTNILGTVEYALQDSRKVDPRPPLSRE
jgi:hypothetical protein